MDNTTHYTFYLAGDEYEEGLHVELRVAPEVEPDNLSAAQVVADVHDLFSSYPLTLTASRHFVGSETYTPPVED
jgi:hypothetical protein